MEKQPGVSHGIHHFTGQIDKGKKKHFGQTTTLYVISHFKECLKMEHKYILKNVKMFAMKNYIIRILICACLLNKNSTDTSILWSEKHLR